MDYLQQLSADTLGPEYVPQLPAIQPVEVPQYQPPATEPVNNSGISADPWADLKAITHRPASEGQLGVQRFEGDITRFKESDDYKTFGYNPNLQYVKGESGQMYDPNEIRYQQAQTWSDVMKNSIGQFAGLSWNSFKESAKSDGRFLNALFNPDSWSEYMSGQSTFMNKVMGSPDELLAADMEQKRIMNTNPIFQSPATEGVFNKEFVGDAIGQLGFTVGTGAYALGTSLLGGAILDGITSVSKARGLTRLGKAMEALGMTGQNMNIAENATKARNLANDINALKEAGDIGKNRDAMTKLWEGMKNMAPGYQMVNDMSMAAKAGATFGEQVTAGLPGLIKSYTMFNAARSEAAMEAAGTYGQLYTSLVDQYTKEHGQVPVGEDLQKIKENAYGAATDNFIVNTGLLMTMNEIEFGSLMSKFSGSKRLLRSAAEAAETAEGKAMYTVTGNEATKVYKAGRFGAMGLFPTIRKDFGLGTALWEVGKQWGRGAGKLEISEGIQEILQSTSDETFRDYYTNLYNGNTDSKGNMLLDITSANWNKGLATQLNGEGWKTFLMGATTGLFLSPLSAATMYARHKGTMSLNQRYKDTYDAQQKVIDDNISILNQYYNDPKTALKEHIAGNKTNNHAVKSMKDALPADDKYTYYNNQNDILTKAAAVAIKTGTYESFINTLKSMGDGRLSDSELREAVNMPDTGDNSNPKERLQQVINGVEQYHKNYEDLMDKYSDLIVPELETDPARYKTALIQKKALQDAIEIVATMGYHGVEAAKRAAEIKTELSKLPTISAASNRAFELLGNPQALKEEIRARKDQLKTLEGLGDPDSREMAKNIQEQVDRLTRWQDGYEQYLKATQATEQEYNAPGFTESFDKLREALKDYLKGYIYAYNKQSNLSTTISSTDIDKAFQMLGDYNALNRDYGQYIEALNVITDPKMFRALHSKIAEGMKAAVIENKKKAEEEIKQRAKSTVPKEEEQITTDDDTTPDTGTTTDQQEEQKPTPEPEKKGTTKTTTKPKQQVQNAEEVKNNIIEHYKKDSATELLPDAKKLLDSNKPLKSALESVAATEDAFPGTYKDDNAYNNDIEQKVNRWFDKNVEDTTPVPEPVEEKEPTIKITRERDQVRIYPIEDRSLYNTLKPVQNSEGKWDVIDIANDNKIIGTKDTEADANDAIKRRIGLLAQLRMDNILRSVPVDQLVDNLQVTVTKNQPGKSFQLGDNPHIQQNREQYTMAISYNGQPVGFITNPNMYTYTFNGQNVDPLSLTRDQFLKIFEIGNRDPDAVLTQWKEDYKTAQNLANELGKMNLQIGQSMSMPISQILNINVNKGEYEYTNDPAKMATLQQLQDKGMQVLVVQDSAGNIMYGDNENLPAIPQHLHSNLKAAVQLPNGDIKWLGAQPGGQSEPNIKELATGITEMYKLPAGEERDKKIQDVKTLAKDIFITLSPKHVIKRIDIKVGTDKKTGDPVMRVGYMTRDGKSGNPSLRSFSTIEELASAINKDLNPYLKKQKIDTTVDIKPENIRINNPRVASVEDVMKMQVSVTPNVVKNLSLTYTVKESGLPISNAPAVTETVIEKGTIEGSSKVSAPVVTMPLKTVQTSKQAEDTMIDDMVSADIPEDAEWDELDRQQMESLQKARLKNAAQKVLPVESFTDNSVVNIDVFKQWAQKTLPQNIVIEDLGTLTNNLNNQNITVGQFLTDLKTIQVYRNSPYKYHEAFHAIFRLLLPEYKIQQLLDIANREHPVTEQGLNQLRKLHPSYAAMDRRTLEERYQEEYMADMFDKWMVDKAVPVSSTIKGFFAKILDWIKEVFSKLTGRRMQSLFYEVNRGKYRNAHIQDNRFTDTGLQMSEPAMKVIEIGAQDIRNSNGDIIAIPKYLPQQKGEQLACTIAALYHQMRQTDEQISKNDLLDKILNMYQETYNKDNPAIREKASAITDKKQRIIWKNDLLKMQQVFSNEDSRQAIKEAVDVHLQLMGYRQELDEDKYADLENRDGVRTTADYNKDADMFGGFTSLSKMLRQYVGSTTRTYTDEFGNTSFLDGTPMIEAVSAAHVYNGMLKVLQNSSDDNVLIDRMKLYVENGNNSETITFINRIFEETGFNKDESGTWSVPKNPLLLQQVIKGFNQYTTNPIFADIAVKGGVKIYSPNRQDSARVQFNNWSQAYNQLFMSQYDQKRGKVAIVTDTMKPLTALRNIMTKGYQGATITDKDLVEKSQTIANEIRTVTGINLHPVYIQYSIVSAGTGERTDYQQRLYNANKNAHALSIEDIDGVGQSMKNDGNIFINIEGDQAKGATTRLMKIAAGNAQFDETVDAMTYRAADGEIHYTSQEPNYYMVRTEQLNDENTINELRNSPDHNNWLLNKDSDFMQMSAQNLITTRMVSGMKVRTDEVSDNEAQIDEEYQSTLEQGKSKAYKTFNEREFTTFMLSSYGAQDNKVYTGTKSTEFFYTTPTLLTVIEAKSTAQMIDMPVQKTVYNGKISQQTLDKLYQEVVKEVKNIQQAKVEIDNETGTIQGYHTGAQRGLKLYNTKLWFTPEKRAEIEQKAQEDPTYIPTRMEITPILNKYWTGRVIAYAQYLNDLELIEIKDGQTINKLLPAFLFNGFGNEDRDTRMNLTDKFSYNLMQIYMNDVLNTMALRQLMHGNEAKAFKDNIDRIKRAAGGNSSGKSASFNYTAPELGIEHTFTKFHHVTFKDPKFDKMNGGKGDKADAQMYCTEKGLRYALFGFGKLSKVQAEILNKLKRGEQVTENEFFGNGGLKEHGPFNSMKVAYFDNNNVYLKCSMFPLFKEYTSVLTDTGWQSIPGMEPLHELRTKLERYETDNETVVYAGPETHSKGLKEDVAPDIAGIDDIHYKELSTQWFRLQMENPSNKLKITDPTQAKQQILSEQNDSTPVHYMRVQSTVGKVKEAYMNDTAQRITNNYESAVNGMFTLENATIELGKSVDIGKVTPQLGQFFQMMKENLEATGGDQQTIDMLEVQNGQPVYDLNHPATLQKYTQLFLNYFSKTMNEKVPGLTVALVSDYGTKRIKQVLEVGEDGQPKRWKVITTAEYKKNPAKYQDAKRWIDDEARTFSGLETGDYIIDDLRHNVPEYDEQGNIIGRYTEYIRPAHYSEEMNNLVPALTKGFGVRIPSDDKHQYIALRMVDTMPVVYGSVGVFSQELLEISGADFDIDKMYIQIADTYIKEGKRVEYGTATTPEGMFEEYVRWQLANNQMFRNLYKGDQLYSTEEVLTELLTKGPINIVRVQEIMKELKMSYNTGKELNNGVLNNRILAAKISLLNNEHIAGGGKDAILNQSTSTDPLTNLAKELVEQGLISAEEEVDINSLHGKTISFINNKEGQRNIGAAINAMLAFSLMEQMGIKLSKDDALEYEGHKYTSFSDPNTTDGVRKFAQISAIVNAMTDNAKERLAAKLGLNITAVGIVSTMVAQGVPLKDAVLYQLQPAVREYYKRLTNRDSVLQNIGESRSADSILESMIDTMSKKVKETKPLTQQDLIDNIKDNGKNQIVQLRTLQDLQTVKKTADSMRTASSIMKLNQGLDVTWEEIDRTQSQINELDDNIYKALEKHPIFHTYLQVFKQVQELSKTMFIERTSLFNNIQEKVMEIMTPPQNNRDKWMLNQKNDLISYLSIKAYIKWLKDRNSIGTLSTMNHSLIYQSEAEKTGYEPITAAIKRLRKSTDNYLVNRFLYIVEHNQVGNKNGLNEITGNSWARLSEQQQQRLYDSFVDLYSNEDTHKDAETLFNYLLVKDGGQFRSGSFIKYIPVFAFKDMLDRTKELNKALVSGDPNYEQLLGVSKDELIKDIQMSFGTHIANKWRLKGIDSNGKSIKRVGDVITIDLSTQDMRDSAAKSGISTLRQIVALEQRREPQYPGDRGDIYNRELYVLSSKQGEDKGVYTRQPFRGSNGQWKGAGVFGDIPVMQRTTVTKKTEEVDNPPYSPEAPAQNIQNVQTTNEQVAVTSPEIDQLTKKYGISAVRIGNQKYYMYKGKIVERYIGIQPAELLQKLDEAAMKPQEPVVPSQQEQEQLLAEEEMKRRTITDEQIEQGLIDCSII